jgi:hypothetical protein
MQASEQFALGRGMLYLTHRVMLAELFLWHFLTRGAWHTPEIIHIDKVKLKIFFDLVVI